MVEIKVIVISSVRPEPTSGGQLTLQRHLIGHPGMTVEVYGEEPEELTPVSLVRRVFGRLRRTRFRRFAEDFWILWSGRWLDSLLPHRLENSGHTAVLTVAHGDVCMAALRFAKTHQLPLVTIFHDWWPDIPDVHRIFRQRLQRDFRMLHKNSTAVLCVSEGMHNALGDHPNSLVLWPIPAKANGAQGSQNRPPRAPSRFRIYYFGNLFEYGPMLAGALNIFSGHKRIRLEVRGANPNWPADFLDTMMAQGFWKDFAPRTELDAWLAEADAFLVPMVFDKLMRRRMETSFPSKLIEFCQLGKPLIVWGPEYCSAVKWARQGNRALCVTDESPVELRNALEQLLASTNEQQRLAAAALEATQATFNPETIQRQFMRTLRMVVSNTLAGSNVDT